MAAGDLTTYTGKDCTIYIDDIAQETMAMSDFGLTIGKGTVEQDLMGQKGNYSTAGSTTVEGSLTSCRLHSTAVGVLLKKMIDADTISISGNTGTNSLYFYFASCQLTSFNFDMGTADDITEGSMDFTLTYPYKVSSVTALGAGGVYVSDFGTKS